MTELNSPINNLSKHKIEDELLKRPIRGLYDISYIYGKLSILNDTARLPNKVNSRYTKYLTPSDSISSEFGEPNSMVTVNFEWDEDEFVYSGVSSYTVDWKLSAKAGYCRPGNKSSQKTVHSITKMTSGSGNDISKISKYLGKTMFTWFDESIIKETSESNMSWVLKEMQQLGSEDLKKEIENDLNTDLEGISKITGLMTLKLIIEGEEYLPGEIDAFNDGMVYNKEKRVKDTSNETQGICYITNVRGSVYGKAFGSPYNLYSSEMSSPHWNFEVKESSRERPLSMDAIMTMMRGSEMIKIYNKSITAEDDRLAYIPYYSNIGYEEAIEMYSVYTKLLDNSDNLFDFIGDWLAYSDYKGSHDKLLYAILFNHQQNSVYVFNKEARKVSESFFEELNKHKETYLRNISESWLSDIITIQHEDDDNKIYVMGDDVIFNNALLSGRFFKDTMGYDNPSWSAFDLLLKLLSGEEFLMESLYDKYVSRIIEQQHFRFNEGLNPIPTEIIWRQVLQMHLLSSVGATKSAKHLIGLSNNKTSMSEKKPENRSERFNLFIKNHNGITTDEQISAFTLGALVGRLSAVQSYSLDLSQTLADNYPVKSISLNRFTQVVQEVIGKNQQYVNSEDIGMYTYYTDMLVDKCLSNDISNWDITTQELRYFYSLGLAYGYSDTYMNKEDSAKDDESTNEFDENETVEIGD